MIGLGETQVWTPHSSELTPLDFSLWGNNGICVQGDVMNSYTTSWTVLTLQPWLPRYPNLTLLAVIIGVQDVTYHNTFPPTRGGGGHCSVTFWILQVMERTILLK